MEAGERSSRVPPLIFCGTRIRIGTAEAHGAELLARVDVGIANFDAVVS